MRIADFVVLLGKDAKKVFDALNSPSAFDYTFSSFFRPASFSFFCRSSGELKVPCTFS